MPVGTRPVTAPAPILRRSVQERHRKAPARNVRRSTNHPRHLRTAFDRGDITTVLASLDPQIEWNRGGARHILARVGVYEPRGHRRRTLRSNPDNVRQDLEDSRRSPLRVRDRKVVPSHWRPGGPITLAGDKNSTRTEGHRHNPSPLTSCLSNAAGTAPHGDRSPDDRAARSIHADRVAHLTRAQDGPSGENPKSSRPEISLTFATEVICHPVLVGLAWAVRHGHWACAWSECS